MMRKLLPYLTLFFLAAAVVTMLPLQMKIAGWILLLLGIATLFFCDKTFRKNLLLVYFCLGVLAIMPINTDVSYSHIVVGLPCLVLGVTIPYLISRYWYKNRIIKFSFHHGRRWYRTEILYIVFTAILSYVILPYYLVSTGSYLNWTVEPNASSLIRLFIGCIILGIWDELFFVCTILGVLRRHFSFPLANITQAIIFTSFLYELGFRGWGFVPIFIFTLIQGYIFKKTESLLYVITIHLTLDLILYLALIYAHHPTWMPIFLVK